MTLECNIHLLKYTFRFSHGSPPSPPLGLEVWPSLLLTSSLRSSAVAPRAHLEPPFPLPLSFHQNNRKGRKKGINRRKSENIAKITRRECENWPDSRNSGVLPRFATLVGQIWSPPRSQLCRQKLRPEFPVSGVLTIPVNRSPRCPGTVVPRGLMARPVFLSA